MGKKFSLVLLSFVLIVFSLSATAANDQDIRYHFLEAPDSCYKAHSGQTGTLRWVVDITNYGPGRMRIVKAAFHDDKAGCAATTASPASGWSTSGRIDYPEGANGQTSFYYNLGARNCGRVQVDAGFRDDYGQDIVFIGSIIDYGVDCPSGPFIDYIDPTVVTKCGSIEIHGKDLTDVVQFFDSSGKRYTVRGTVNAARTLTTIAIPAEVPAGVTRVRIYAAADRVSNEKTITINECNKPPKVISCSPSMDSVRIGEAVTIHYSIVDPEGNPFTVRIDWGDGTISSGGQNSASHAYQSTGTFTVRIRAKDSKEAQSIWKSCGSITVITSQNLPPEIPACNVPSSVVVNTQTTISYTVTDPNGDPVTVDVNWGDGAILPGGLTSASHTYAATGAFNVAVTATDNHGASTTKACGTITVIPSTTNNPPVISSCTSPSSVQSGQTATINYTVTDFEGDPFTILVNWGDGATSSGGPSSASHVYNTLGSYQVTITATDSRGASSSSSCGTIVVLCPSCPPIEPPTACSGKMRIIDVDAKVDGKTSNNLHDNGRISKEAGPESKVELKVTVQNLFNRTGDIDIEDIQVKATIEGIDDGDDLEEEANEFDLSPEDDKTVTLKFQLPLNIDEGSYDISIEAEGESEECDLSDNVDIELEVEKEKHDLRFRRLDLSKASVSCNESFVLSYEIINLGQEDEENAFVEIRNTDLGIDILHKGISISEGTEDNRYLRSENLRIKNKVSDGVYPITVNAYSDDSELQDAKTLQLDVQKCGKTTEEGEKKQATLVGSKIDMTTTETVERTIQIPIIEIFFKGSSRATYWLLISTLILSIFFVLVAMVAMAKAEE